MAAKNVADLIDAIYVQERNENTDAQCEAAKAAWDALTDAQKELVEGEEADPDYFGRDTGDASKDDARNQDNIGDNHPGRQLRPLLQQQPRSGHQGHRGCHPGRISRLVCPPCLHRTDHHQPCSGP